MEKNQFICYAHGTSVLRGYKIYMKNVSGHVIKTITVYGIILFDICVLWSFVQLYQS